MGKRAVSLLAIVQIACGGSSGSTPNDAATADEATTDVASDGSSEDSGGSDTAEPEDVDPGDGTIFPVEDTGAPPSDSSTVPTDAPSDGGIADYPLPPIPSTCTRHARVITYNPNGWEILADAFEANRTACADYYIHLPAVVADKTQPRGPTQPALTRARKGRFHAVAEFHFGEWSKRTDLSWYAKGVEFRKRMAAENYNVARGDTWAINELPSTVRSDATVRSNVIELVRGLYTGPTGSPPVSGIVFVINMGHETTNFTVYKPNLASWTTASSFWTEMDKYVRFWGQEAYTSAPRVCVPGATVAARADRVNDFVMHPARLAYASGAPTTTSAARTFFNTSYFPLLTAYWKSAGPYGTTTVTLSQMKYHVSLQTYSVRLWAETNSYPDGRIGFAWDNSAGTLTELTDLATRLASSIKEAYDPGGTAAKACSPTGAYTWCGCSITGATFNDAWNTFATW